MTALTSKKENKFQVFTSIELPGKAEQVYQGGLATIDTSTGLVAKAFVSTTLIPIGTYAVDQLTTSGQTVLVKLSREVRARWYSNSTSTDAIAAAQLGQDCYMVDDQTVAKTSGSSSRSVAGRVWKVDSLKGVLVEHYAH